MGKIPELSECNPGILPMEYKVIVAPEDTEEVTAGGIILTNNVKETNDLAAVKGRLVAVSPLAFSYAAPEEWGDHRKPQVGDAVLFAKYGGTLVKASDGREYRVMHDKDIMAVLEG